MDSIITEEQVEASVPDTSKSFLLNGIDNSIEIYRDSFGIPHVKAKSTYDAFFGQGFVTAQDRLWHMDYDRHRAYGRWAEVIGISGLDHDKMMRRFQIADSVRKDYLVLNAETKCMLDAYADGVNAYIKNADSMPVEYILLNKSPAIWNPWDSLAVYKVRHIMMGVFESKLWRDHLVDLIGGDRSSSLLKGYQPGHLIIVPPSAEFNGNPADGSVFLRRSSRLSICDDPDSGSNSWALSGKRTASGKPLMAGDPHRGLDTPSVYYQNHISCPEFDAIGLSFPGYPGFPHFGHNSHVAWCVTHAGSDYQDIYIEKFQSDNSSYYEYNGEWIKAETKRELIDVRDGKPEHLEVIITQHGPIIDGDPSKGYGLSFKYTSTHGLNRGVECILPMMSSSSTEEIDQAMEKWVDPCNNFVFADINGDIGYLNRGRVPIRPMANAWLPVPGWTDEFEWKGDIPFSELARLSNPDTGYIVTANNRIVQSDYPYYIALSFAPEYRARRILDRVKELKDATIQDMMSIHSEMVSIPAQTYVPLLLEAKIEDSFSIRARKRLMNWSGSMDRETVAPTIFSAFRIHLHKTLLKHLMGEKLADEALSALGRGAPSHRRDLEALFVTMARKGDKSFLPNDDDWQSVLAEAFVQGIRYLRNQLGDEIDAWKWGMVHRTRPRHPLSEYFLEIASLLDPPSVAMHGDGDTPHAAGYAPFKPFEVTGTSVARYIFDLADWNNCLWVVPFGGSGHPGSKHYIDQLPVWSDSKLIPMLYDWKRIKSEATTHQILNSVI